MANHVRPALMLGPQHGQLVANNVNLNAAANWFAMAFIPKESKTVSAIKLRIASVTGALGATDLQLDIFSDTGGIGVSVPNASLASSTTVTTQATSGNTPLLVEWTGFSLALTAGTQYWFVLRNNNGTPASNFPAVGGFGQSGASQFGNLCFQSQSSRGDCAVLTSTNSGSTWSTVGSWNIQPFRVQYNDSTYDGFPCLSVSTALHKSFSGNESGVVFTCPGPSGLTINVVGIALQVSVQGTNPTVGPACRLFSGTNTLPMGTSLTYPLGDVNSGGGANFVPFYFTSPQALIGGNQYRATVFDNTDGSGAAYSPQTVTYENDANSLALLPFKGTLKSTLLSGGTWTDTSTDYTPLALLLDWGNEFL